tara:strand:- start:54 stop:185 length:132 start_codon:yes stop_codon:yes gene_type:complete
MIALDTDVVLRFLTHDAIQQSALAVRFFWLSADKNPAISPATS